jgi:hypothetical protein
MRKGLVHKLMLGIPILATAMSLSNPLYSQSRSQGKFCVTINEHTGKEEYFAKDHSTEMVIKRAFIIFQVENPNLDSLYHASEYDYWTLENETKRNLCKKLDTDKNMIIDNGEVANLYNELAEDDRFRYVEDM